MTDKRLWLMAGAGVMIGFVSVGGVMASHRPAPRADIRPAPTVSATPYQSPRLTAMSYAGKDGQTALSLLKQRAVVVIQGSGSMAYVVSINGYRANEAKHQYWTVYLNGQPSEEAPATVITHDSDQVEWRIVTY